MCVHESGNNLGQTKKAGPGWTDAIYDALLERNLFPIGAESNWRITIITRCHWLEHSTRRIYNYIYNFSAHLHDAHFLILLKHEQWYCSWGTNNCAFLHFQTGKNTAQGTLCSIPDRTTLYKPWPCQTPQLCSMNNCIHSAGHSHDAVKKKCILRHTWKAHISQWWCHRDAKMESHCSHAVSIYLVVYYLHPMSIACYK